MNQRDKMRELYKVYGNDEEALVREYAAAERRGEVPRWRNLSNLTPEQYARMVLRDARRKGWLPGFK